MSRILPGPEGVNPTKIDASKTDGVSHSEVLETAHSSSLKSKKSTAVEESQKPAVKENKISSDEHSSNSDIPSINENNAEEPKKPEERAARDEGDAETVSVEEETKSLDCKNLGTGTTDLDSNDPSTFQEKDIQTDQTVSCLLFLNFICFALNRILLGSKECKEQAVLMQICLLLFTN